MQPLLSNEEFERTRKVVADFGRRGGVGEKLQKKLMERAEAKESWVRCKYYTDLLPRLMCMVREKACTLSS